MRVLDNGNSVTLWASARDTYDWAHKPGAAWPCSTLSGRRFVAVFDSNGLCDLSLDGGRGEQDCDSWELSAMCADFLRGRIGADHPCADVVLGAPEAS